MVTRTTARAASAIVAHRATKAKYNAAAREHATKMSQAFLTATIRQCERVRADSQSAIRHGHRQCQYCYYLRSSIVGQGFTQYICTGCRKTLQHPNTGIPVLCPKCSDKWRACSRCGGARELNTVSGLSPLAIASGKQAKKPRKAK